jgi:hypothetical protein
MEGWHRRSSCHPAALSKTSDRVPRASVNSDQQQLARQFRHGLLTALEAFPKLILGRRATPAGVDAAGTRAVGLLGVDLQPIELARLVTRLQSVSG